MQALEGLKKGMLVDGLLPDRRLMVQEAIKLHRYS